MLLTLYYSQFQYAFLPVGLNVSAVIFQNAMNNIISNLSGISAYQDGIIVHAPTKKLRDERLRLLFELLRN